MTHEQVLPENLEAWAEWIVWSECEECHHKIQVVKDSIPTRRVCALCELGFTEHGPELHVQMFNIEGSVRTT